MRISQMFLVLLVLEIFSVHGFAQGQNHHHEDEGSFLEINIDAETDLNSEEQHRIVDQVHEALEGHDHHAKRSWKQFFSDWVHTFNFYQKYLNARRIRNFAGDSEGPAAAWIKSAVFYFFASHTFEVTSSWSLVAFAYVAGWSPAAMSAATTGATVISAPLVADPVCWIVQGCLLQPTIAKPMHAVRRFLEKYTIQPVLVGIKGVYKSLGGEKLAKFADAMPFLYFAALNKGFAQIKLFPILGIENEPVAEVVLLNSLKQPMMTMRLDRGKKEQLFVSNLLVHDPSSLTKAHFETIAETLKLFGINVHNAINSIVYSHLFCKGKCDHSFEEKNRSFMHEIRRLEGGAVEFTFIPRALDVPRKAYFFWSEGFDTDCGEIFRRQTMTTPAPQVN